MRIETIRAWLLVGFCLLIIGMLLSMFEVIAKNWGLILALLGFVYFCIGAALSVMHDRHMVKRTRARQEQE
jgi:membrane-bound ClpP family serine protease